VTEVASAAAVRAPLRRGKTHSRLGETSERACAHSAGSNQQTRKPAVLTDRDAIGDAARTRRTPDVLLKDGPTGELANVAAEIVTRQWTKLQGWKNNRTGRKAVGARRRFSSLVICSVVFQSSICIVPVM